MRTRRSLLSLAFPAVPYSTLSQKQKTLSQNKTLYHKKQNIISQTTKYYLTSNKTLSHKQQNIISQTIKHLCHKEQNIVSQRTKLYLTKNKTLANKQQNIISQTTNTVSKTTIHCLANNKTLSHKQTKISGKEKVLNKKYLFWFSLELCVWDISHYKNSSARYCYKCT